MEPDTTAIAAYDWAALQAAYAEGRFESRGHLLCPHLVFEDGTIWFTEGVEMKGSHQALLPLLGGLFVIMLGGTIVCIADGLIYGWAFAGGLAVAVALIAMVLRKSNRIEREARGQLRIGVFFRPEQVVIRDREDERTIARDRVAEIVVRRANKGEETSSDWLHLRVGGEVVPTHIRLVGESGQEQLQLVQSWLDR